jgi:hypothetical protein
MCLPLRRIIVALIALSFLASGFGRGAVAIASEPCHPQPELVAHDSEAHAHGDHAAHHPAANDDEERTGGGGKASDECFKCCGMCTASPQLPTADPSNSGRFISYRVAYFAFAEGWADRPLIIDPGIPKRTV